MNKVLVDRELLESLLDDPRLVVAMKSEQVYGIKEASTQPVEAEGTVQCPVSHPAECYAPGTHVVHASLVHGIVRKADELNAALSAVTAERDRLEEALNFACKALCHVTSSDGSGHADIALSVLRLAGVDADEREALVEGWKANVKWRADAAMAVKDVDKI